MPQVSLSINGKSYNVACDAGQDKRVRELGQYIDKRVREIAAQSGPATDAHLLVLAALVLSDELFDTRDHMAQAQRAAHQLQRQQRQDEAAAPAVDWGDIAQRVADLTGRVDQIATKVKKAA